MREKPSGVITSRHLFSEITASKIKFGCVVGLKVRLNNDRHCSRRDAVIQVYKAYIGSNTIMPKDVLGCACNNGSWLCCCELIS